jgi:1-deoxy-D-xylulose-5-phosphate reductoisomerase
VETNFAKLATLTFEEPDLDRFPSLNLARRAGDTGGTLPAVFNAANEIAVDAFCERKLGFADIPAVVARTMEHHQVIPHPTLEEILAADAWARLETRGE